MALYNIISSVKGEFNFEIYIKFVAYIFYNVITIRFNIIFNELVHTINMYMEVNINIELLRIFTNSVQNYVYFFDKLEKKKKYL